MNIYNWTSQPEKLAIWNRTVKVVNQRGNQEWFKNGLRHRDGDLPAIIRADGTKLWYKNGLRHRDGDLPAVIHPGGTKSWWKNGWMHRDGDQPAVIYADGTQAWYKNDNHIASSPQEYEQWKASQGNK